MLPSPARRCPVFLLRKHVCFHQAAALAASCSFRLHVVPKTARMSHFPLQAMEASVYGRNVWHYYCDAFGDGIRDPVR